MRARIRLVLVLLYPLLLLGRLLNVLLGRDPLRLREPVSETLWIARVPAEPKATSYFIELSEVEGRGHGGFGKLAGGSLVKVARLLAPSRRRAGEAFRGAEDRDRDIPDEIYTLW